jgi:hypothetical protein
VPPTASSLSLNAVLPDTTASALPYEALFSSSEAFSIVSVVM